jgi:hypothetical protein
MDKLKLEVIALPDYRDGECINCGRQKYSNEAFYPESKESLLKSKQAAKYEQKRRDNHTH